MLSLSNRWIRKAALILSTAAITFTPLTSFAVPAGKLVQFLSHQSHMVDIFTRNGIEELTARKAYQNMQVAWQSLSPSGKVPSTAEEAREILQGLDADSSDQQSLSRVYRILSKDQDKVTSKDLKTMYNDIAHLTNRYSAMMTACRSCMSEAMGSSGFAYTIREIQNKNARELVGDIIPTDPRERRNFITHYMNKHELGSFQKDSSLVREEEEKGLAIFLGLLEHGNSAEKEFAQSVVNLSRTPSGEVKLLNDNNPHSFWTLFVDSDFDQTTMRMWTRAINQVAEDAEDVEDTRKVFYAHLSKRAEDDPELKRLLRTMKERDCFYR